MINTSNLEIKVRLNLNQKRQWRKKAKGCHSISLRVDRDASLKFRKTNIHQSSNIQKNRISTQVSLLYNKICPHSTPWRSFQYQGISYISMGGNKRHKYTPWANRPRTHTVEHYSNNCSTNHESTVHVQERFFFSCQRWYTVLKFVLKSEPKTKQQLNKTNKNNLVHDDVGLHVLGCRRTTSYSWIMYLYISRFHTPDLNCSFTCHIY